MTRSTSPAKPRPTMKDVAVAAGVSQSTVSFVLNGLEDMRISRETRNRVLKAVKEIGYRPRSAGRPPKGAGHSVIGVMMDEIATSPFAAISLEAIQETAWKNDIIVEAVMTGGNPEYENAVLRKWSADRVRGVIYSSILTHRVKPPTALANHRSVLMNCYDESGMFASIVPAERRGGEVATKTLIESGRKRIAFIAGESWMDASAQRFEGYKKAISESAVEYSNELVVAGNFLPSGGREATLLLMSKTSKPDAIFCANDLMAVGCYEALKELGIEIGKDIAVVGYDDQEIAQHLHPTLTTVLLPHGEMGRVATKTLISSEDIIPSERRIECPLVERKSHG